MTVESEGALFVPLNWYMAQRAEDRAARELEREDMRRMWDELRQEVRELAEKVSVANTSDARDDGADSALAETRARRRAVWLMVTATLLASFLGGAVTALLRVLNVG